MSLNIINEPWFESPFFYQLLRKKKVNKNYKKIATDMHEKSYAIIDLNVIDNLINSKKKNISTTIINDNAMKKPKMSQYKKFPRKVKEWKY